MLDATVAAVSPIAIARLPISAPQQPRAGAPRFRPTYHWSSKWLSQRHKEASRHPL